MGGCGGRRWQTMVEKNYLYNTKHKHKIELKKKLLDKQKQITNLKKIKKIR